MHRRFRLIVLPLLLVGVVLAAQDRRPAVTSSPAPARRVALVIGNDTYTGVPLRNARNDARAMAVALRKLSFEVTAVEDATRSRLSAAMLAFTRKLGANDLAFVFYAGHGVQVEGVNYLIPTDFAGHSEDEVRVDAVSSDEIARALRRARIGVLVLDACRDNPYSGQRSTGRGLAQLESQGLLVAFATGAGQTAGDAPGAVNGIFTSELIQVLGQPGRGLRETFFDVQRRVQQRTGGKQFPAVYSQLMDDVVLTPSAASSPAPPAPSAPANSGEAALRAETAFWESIRDSRDESMLDAYLSQYPNGTFRALAQAKMRALRAVATPEGAASGATSAGAEKGGDSSIRWARIASGTFQMGCVPGDGACDADEAPRHAQTVAAFRLMTTDVTVAQFRRFAENTSYRTMAESTGRSNGWSGSGWTQVSGMNWRNPGFSQSDLHPVVHVSSDDAVAFCSALGSRLPTEAEWEYAARGGVDGAIYVWGSSQSPVVNGQKAANVGDEIFSRNYPNFQRFAGYDDGYAETSPVGSFAPNRFGLYDMAGNVWQWTSTIYKPYPYRAGDGREDQRSRDLRVMRGGAWSSYSQRVRSANRNYIDAHYTSDDGGFRCAQSGS